MQPRPSTLGAIQAELGLHESTISVIESFILANPATRHEPGTLSRAIDPPANQVSALAVRNDEVDCDQRRASHDLKKGRGVEHVIRQQYWNRTTVVPPTNQPSNVARQSCVGPATATTARQEEVGEACEVRYNNALAACGRLACTPFHRYK